MTGRLMPLGVLVIILGLLGCRGSKDNEEQQALQGQDLRTDYSPPKLDEVSKDDGGRPRTRLRPLPPKPITVEKPAPAPAVDKGPDTTALDDRVQAASSSIRACLPASAIDQPETSVSVSLTIHPTGRVLDASAEGSGLDFDHKSCMRRVLMSLSFPSFEAEGAFGFSTNVRFKRQAITPLEG